MARNREAEISLLCCLWSTWFTQRCMCVKVKPSLSNSAASLRTDQTDSKQHHPALLRVRQQALWPATPMQRLPLIDKWQREGGTKRVGGDTISETPPGSTRFDCQTILCNGITSSRPGPLLPNGIYPGLGRNSF
eukprot:scaffold2316_cov218-Pinguiococcus_pyrenoidosus.AAC.3